MREELPWRGKAQHKTLLRVEEDSGSTYSPKMDLLHMFETLKTQVILTYLCDGLENVWLCSLNARHHLCHRRHPWQRGHLISLFLKIYLCFIHMRHFGHLILLKIYLCFTSAGKSDWFQCIPACFSFWFLPFLTATDLTVAIALSHLHTYNTLIYSWDKWTEIEKQHTSGLTVKKSPLINFLVFLSKMHFHMTLQLW